MYIKNRDLLKTSNKMETIGSVRYMYKLIQY